MRVLRTFFLCLMVAVLAAFYWFNVLRKAETKPALDPQAAVQASQENKQDDASKFVFPNQNNQEIIFLSFQPFLQKENLSFEKKNGEWVMTFPVKHPALSTLISALVNVIKSSQRLKTFPLVTSADANRYGFQDPRLEVCVRFQGDTSAKCMLIGDESSFTNASYGWVTDEQEVFLVSDVLTSAFENQSRYDLLRKQIFPYALLESVLIQRNELKLVLAREQEVWQLTKPRQKSIKKEKAERLLNLLNNLHIREFEYLEQNNNRFGFQEEQDIFMTVHFRNGKSETLFIGSEVEGFSAYYGRFKMMPLVVQISKEKVDEIFSLSSELLFQGNYIGGP